MWKLIKLLFSIQLCGFCLAQEKDTLIKNSDNSLVFKGKIIDERKIGLWSQYDSTGALMNLVQFSENGVNCNVYPSFLRAGDSCNIEARFCRDSLIYHGSFYLRLNSKKSVEAGVYENGKKVGQWRYYENNVLRALWYYDFESITTLYFNQSGQLVQRYGSNIISNQLDGLFIKMDDSCRIKEIGYYKNGCKDGEWRYYSNGELKSKGTYYNDCIIFNSEHLIFLNKNGLDAKNLYSTNVLNLFNVNDQVLYLKDGIWLYYNNGHIIREELYNKGELIKTKKKKHDSNERS